MSALLEQFVEEAGDLLESAGGALLALERNPADDRAVNDLFRSVHTLKGTSALFELPALTKLVHAGEDVLDLVREGTIPVSAQLVDIQLEVLDLLRVWIDALRADGVLPPDAGTVSRALIERLREAKLSAGSAAAVPAADDGLVGRKEPSPDADWLDVLPEAARMAAFRAAMTDGHELFAIDFTPDADCFFRGEDPLATCRSLPDLLALAFATVGPDPDIADFDPYVCRLRIAALSTVPRPELEHLFRYVEDQVRIFAFAPQGLAALRGSTEIDADCAGFAAAAEDLIERGELAALRDRARELEAALDPGWRSASALRWLDVLLESGVERADWLVALTRAVGGAQLDWSAPAARPAAAPTVPTSDLVDRLFAEQCDILTLPADDAGILRGRIASVGRTLANIAAAQRADAAVRVLESATAQALQSGDPQLLRAAAIAVFSAVPSAQAAGPDGAYAGAAAGSGEAHAGALGRSGSGGPAGPPKIDTPQARKPSLLKVDQAKVDRLMALIGELVVAKNALPFLARRAENVHGSRELGREIGQRYSVIDRLAQEMQEAIMEVRLLPVSEVFARFPRLIRDVSRKLDKQIELVLEGEETQADKNIIELLGDPLIHIVRNAADHGIESPQARTAAGKPAHGTIRLRAMQEGDRVVIEVSDDGRGVDTARVVAKALERGVIDAETAQRMTPAEAANLIFHPGLSTAETVSDLSGRGVGMDVVQTAIHNAGGSVAVTSQPGNGTTVRLALPLSMAVMRVMTIETAGALYGVPIDVIAETVRVDTSAIRLIKQSEAFMLRDTIVPLVRLRGLLRLPGHSEEREAVLVLRTAGGLVGLIVDRFDEHMDIILKPLEGILAGLRGFAGTALLGDGRVLMILDVKELL